MLKVTYFMSKLIFILNGHNCIMIPKFALNLFETAAFTFH